MKILVIFTGGTIGSQAGGEYIALDGKNPYKLIQMYRERYPQAGNNGDNKTEDVEFYTDTPYTVLSENMDCAMYFRLARAVRRSVDSYDGIIVTHGSDTLQYSAAMLSYVLGNIGIPVMVVASNYVLEDERANGLINFACAVEFIKKGCGRGVYVPYANDGENCKVHYALKLMPHVMYSDYLYSLDDDCYGEFRDGVFCLSQPDCEKNNNLPDAEINSFFPLSDDGDDESVRDCSGILWINVHPGMVCPRLTKEVKAVLISAYHSGTVCVEYSPFAGMLEEARRNGIPVYLAGAYEGKDYESCREYEAMGIRVLEKVSPSAAYIRLWLEYGLG